MLENKDPNLTPLSHFGEFRFIEHITKDFESYNPRVIKAVGDDAAVYEVGNNEVNVVSTDLLVEGIHFDLSYVPMRHLGYKAVAVNLSDIYAMNAEPFGITVSVAMSNRFSLEAMEEFYAGVKFACERYGVDLLGGDTSSSRKGLIISVTAIGKAQKDKVVYRSGANENDLLCLSGDIGAAYAGLQILEREKAVFMDNPDIQPDLTGYDYIIGRQLKPEARKDVYELLREKEIVPTSMIDLSDGLASDLLHICKQSGVGATIYEDKLMIDHEVNSVSEEFKIPAVTMAMNGGEDYELLFTVPLSDYDKLKDSTRVFIIGHVTDKTSGVNLITGTGTQIPVTAQGWDHFDEEETEE